MKLWKEICRWIRGFLLFFLLIGFVITCSFLLFFHAVSLPEESVRQIAPVVFSNVFVLAALFVTIDAIRRKLTVARPVKKILQVLTQIMAGDFRARISVPSLENGGSEFREIAKSINTMAEELAGVETLRTDFVANVSHELKTPLAIMQNYAMMLQSPGLPEEKKNEYAKAIVEASRRLTDLITNILKLNKLENQQIFPETEEYDLGEQLCECLIRFEEEWEKKELVIETDIEEAVRIRSDAELLSLVWNNLISNAIKFTERGGTISLRLKRDGDTRIVEVSDTGCGMTAETGAHIFEKFYQGDTSHAGKGNGLGLALVKRVVDIVHGEISVESTLGKGTTFTVRITEETAE
ncbi:MAG: HAMP domain-containing histidine kinase [Lachnospiraceae bacterium]|nr:HAMP domain-containing histidine kinase [Lachnospiraceae bacterium]